MKNISILRHGKQAVENDRKNAAAIGQKLIRLGRLLQNPDLSTIVPKRYFDRINNQNSVFFAIMHGDNGVSFEVCCLVEQLSDEDSFDVADVIEGIEVLK